MERLIVHWMCLTCWKKQQGRYPPRRTVEAARVPVAFCCYCGRRSPEYAPLTLHKPVPACEGHL